MTRSRRPTGSEGLIEASRACACSGGDLGGLALDDRVAFGFDGRGGVNDGDVPVDEAVEEASQRGEVELLRGRGEFKSLKIFADVAGGDPRQFEMTVVGPGEELADGVHVVLAGVGVGELGLEEFLPGERGGLAGELDDRRGIAGGDDVVRSEQFSGLGCVAGDDGACLIHDF